MDSNLKNRLIEIDALGYSKNSKIRTTLELNGNKVNGNWEVFDNGKIVFDIQSRCNDPKQEKRFIEDLIPKHLIGHTLPENFTTPTFQINHHTPSNERQAEIALLRIGYLLTFATFGNGFYANPSLYKVREQIHNPEKEVLPKVFWITANFNALMDGIYVISYPKELRCFLALFHLQTDSVRKQYAIAIPGPTEPGIKIYDNIEKYLCSGDGSKSIEPKMHPIPNYDYLKNKELAYASTEIWKTLAS